MIKHYCDGCGTEVNEENGVIHMKEMTLEFPDRKVSIAIEVDRTDKKSLASDDHPAVCSGCIAMKINDWAQRAALESASERVD